MTTRSFALSILFAMLLLPGLAGVAGAATAGEQAADSCRVCGKAMANAHIGFIIEHPDGRTERLGCANCGFAELRNLDEVAGVRTIDFLRGAEIDARNAFYVKGSSFTGCCEPSYLAFAEREEAERFARGFGGTVLDFAAALGAAPGHDSH